MAFEWIDFKSKVSIMRLLVFIDRLTYLRFFADSHMYKGIHTRATDCKLGRIDI